MNILFLSKHKPFADEAASLVRANIDQAEIVFGKRKDPFPKAVLAGQYDYIISYISPWIVPKILLDQTRIAAINFHPGPPEYPGIGCTNFAIYNAEKEYGITVHHMTEKVDSGKIIAVERFPVFPHDSVYSLTQRCYAFIYVAFVRTLKTILKGESLPKDVSRWTRKPYTRQELDDLCRLRKDMSETEVQRRLKATAFPGMPGAYWEDKVIR